MGGESTNVKRTSVDGHHESVQNSAGEEVKGENAATFNFYSAETQPVKHVVGDVVPWVAVGTLSPGDKSTIGSRVKALVSAIFEK